jgi:hypothetical protein
MSTKITNAINSLIFDEKNDQIEAIKAFINGKIDNAEEVCKLLDEFGFSNEKKCLKVKSTKSKTKNDGTPRKPKKLSFYNYWLGDRMRSFCQEQKNLPNEEQIEKRGIMKVLALEWKNYKETPNFSKEMNDWKETSSSESEDDKELVNEKKKKPLKKPSVTSTPSITPHQEQSVAKIESENDASDEDI